MKRSTTFVHTILCLLNLHVCSAIGVDNLKLELLQVIFRHGARTPNGKLESHFLNVSNPAFYWREGGFEQLTNLGKQQAYTLGVSLRKKYNDFLGAYNPQEYYAMSSRYDRTKMSMQLALAGLFPPSSENSLNEKLHWQPIPFVQQFPGMNFTLFPIDDKPFMDFMKKSVANALDHVKEMKRYAEFFEFMTNEMSIPYTEGDLYNNFGYSFLALEAALSISHQPLPNWGKPKLTYTYLQELSHILLELTTSWTPQLRRIYGGGLIQRLMKNIDNNRDAVVPKKIYLYAAHDMAVYAITKAQDSNVFFVVPYGSTLIMEMYTDIQKFEYIRMLAWNPNESDNFKTVKIGKCAEYCPLNDYLEIVKKYYPTEMDLEIINKIKD